MARQRDPKEVILTFDVSPEIHECREGQWMPMLMVDGDEVWVDQTMVDCKITARNLAVAYHEAYMAGVKTMINRVTNADCDFPIPTVKVVEMEKDDEKDLEL